MDPVSYTHLQVEVERYLKAHMNFGLSDVEVDEYQAKDVYKRQHEDLIKLKGTYYQLYTGKLELS